MKIKIASIIAITCLTGPLVHSNTPILFDLDFSEAFSNPTPEPQGTWRAGTNHFMEGWDWRFWDEARDGYYQMTDRVNPSGGGFEFFSYDDYTASQEAANQDPPDIRFLWPRGDTVNGVYTPSDWLFNSLFQEQLAGPTDGIFKAGDTIVFKGRAKATRVTDANADMDMNAMIIVAGWIGSLNFQERQWTVKKALTSTLEDFELRTTFPTEAEIGVDELQVVKIGFEINNKWDADAEVMDEGSIYFENLEAYIESAGPAPWNGFAVDENGWADTGDWMGMVNVAADPWIWVNDLTKYLYIPSEGTGTGGAWVYANAQ